jgi:hypothetical protein
VDELLKSRTRSVFVQQGTFHEEENTETSAGAECIPVWRLMLRITADFVTFSEPAELTRFAAPGWAAAQLQYPSFLSADGSRQDEVDASGFYVLGTCSTAAEPCVSTFGPQVTAAAVSVALEN